jgi:hypothetical protein
MARLRPDAVRRHANCALAEGNLVAGAITAGAPSRPIAAG